MHNTDESAMIYNPSLSVPEHNSSSDELESASDGKKDPEGTYIYIYVWLYMYIRRYI